MLHSIFVLKTMHRKVLVEAAVDSGSKKKEERG